MALAAGKVEDVEESQAALPEAHVRKRTRAGERSASKGFDMFKREEGSPRRRVGLPRRRVQSCKIAGTDHKV